MKKASGGVGFMGLLFLVFLVLKLCGVIAWSWWWVTAPLWGPPLALIALLMVCCLIAGLIFFIAICIKPR